MFIHQFGIIYRKITVIQCGEEDRRFILISLKLTCFFCCCQHQALSQLTEASDRERELLQQNATFQEQLTVLRTDLERSQANSNLKESHILEENEALKEQLEDFRRDLKLNRDALTQTVYNCNNQVTTLKSELAMITTRLDNERQTRETLEVEVESTRTRLAGAIKEAERCLAAHADTEKALLREKEEHQRLKDKLTG